VAYNILVFMRHAVCVA